MGRSVVALQCFPWSVRRKREEAYHKLPCVPEGLVTSVRSVHISCFCSILSGIILGYVEKCFLDRGLPILLPLSLVSSSIPLSFSSPCPRSTIRFPLLASHPQPDNPKREKYVEFPGQPHERSNATPVFEPRFRSS